MAARAESAGAAVNIKEALRTLRNSRTDHEAIVAAIRADERERVAKALDSDFDQERSPPMCGVEIVEFVRGLK